MYHFVSEQTAELRLSENVLITSHTTQYLKCFQLEAVRFLHERLSKQEFCIFNDESGLGKSASIVALLNGLGTAKKTLIVLQNDDNLLAGWQFHLGVLSDLPVCVVKDVNNSTESAHSVYLSKWSILRSIGDLSKLKFDYIIVDHRGYSLNNSFCTSMLLKQYERKVNIVISSMDITSDVKLLYNVLRLGGCLEHQYNTFQAFERKFHLPDVKEVLSKRVELEEYYKQRGVLGEYIKDFRLRRYRHQFESYLPLVTTEQYKTNLSLWLGENNSNSTISQTTIESSAEALSTGGTDDIFECLMNMKRERESQDQADPEGMAVSGCSDDVIAMEPLVLHMSDSEADEIVPESEEETVPVVVPVLSSDDIVMISSDDCEIVTPPNTPPHVSQVPTTSPATRKKRKFKRLQTAKPTDLSESDTEPYEPTTSKSKGKKLNVRLSRIAMPQTNREEEATSSKKSVEQPTKLTPTKATKSSQKLSAERSPEKNKNSPDPSVKKSTQVSIQPSVQKAPLRSPQVKSPETSATKKAQELSSKNTPEQKTHEYKNSANSSTKKTPKEKAQLKPAQLARTTSESSLKNAEVMKPASATHKKSPDLKAKMSLEKSTSTQVTKPEFKSSRSPVATVKKTEELKSTPASSKKAEDQAKPLNTKQPTKPTSATPKKPTEQTDKNSQQLNTPLKTTRRTVNATKEKNEQKTPLKDTKPVQVAVNNTPDQRNQTPSPELITPKQEKSATTRTKRSCLLEKNSNSADVEPRQTRGMQRLTRSADTRLLSKYKNSLKQLEFDNKRTPNAKRRLDINQTPSSRRRNLEDKVKLEVVAENKSKAAEERSKAAEEKSKSAEVNSKATKDKSKSAEEETQLKRGRGRPAKNNSPNEALATEEESKPKRGPGRPAKNKSPKEEPTPLTRKNQKEKYCKAATPELLSSGSIVSDYSYMQCGQKLPDNLAELESFSEFRIPEVPQATPLMLPSTLNFFSDSEVVVVPSSNPKPDVVVINSSNEECSQQSTSQSRRTRALKRKSSNSSKEQSQPSTSNFGLLLAQQRAGVNKSPDLFSNCSDFSQITLAQPVPPASPFEGFKIFGSEVKQLQQQHAKAQPATVPQKKRERSCLDILENMFEPRKTKANVSGINLLPMLPSPKKQLPQRRFTLLDEDIFEITNNGEFGNRLRLNSSGNVSPVNQQQQQQPPATQQLEQRNKITKYLIGSNCTPEDAGQRSQPSLATRKSPKSIKSTQSTKLTRWFNTTDTAGSQSAPSTPVVPADKTAAARAARSGGAAKRKKLNLCKS